MKDARGHGSNAKGIHSSGIIAAVPPVDWMKQASDAGRERVSKLLAARAKSANRRYQQALAAMSSGGSL